MGEQGAKTLRGGKMEDVIFAGTAGARAAGPGRGRADHRQLRRRAAHRLRRGHHRADDVPQRRLGVRDQLPTRPAAGHPGAAVSDSGIGREMHVIVGQGQLDSILQATPEIRRGFIEEAAGVLKHRKRKEKALRKLEACEGNLNRLSDLIGEIRRQLKPLGRQAEVARKAAVIQAELRDAKARLLADDLVQATAALESDLADEQAMQQRRRRARGGAGAGPRSARSTPRTPYARPCPRWSSGPGDLVLAGRAAGTGRPPRCPSPGSGCGTPTTNRASCGSAATPTSWTGRRMPIAGQEQAAVRARLPQKVRRWPMPSAYAAERESARQAEEARLAGLVRAAADRREGLARLTGQVNSLRSRAAGGRGRDRPADRGPPGGSRTRGPGRPSIHRPGDEGGGSGRG